MAAMIIATSDSPMPTRTACSAIRLERRAMRIASARASIRSTVSTTSAASDEAVGPARGERDARTRPRRAPGASLTPSPTMIVAPSADSRSIAASLSAGSQSASTVSTPTTRPTMSAMSARSPVTSTTRRIPALRSARTIRGASGRIASCEQERARGLVVDGSEHRQRAVQVGAPAHLPHPHGGFSADDPGRLAEPHPVGRRPCPPGRSRGTSRTELGICRASPRRVPAVTSRAGQDVRRDLIERRGEPQQLVCGPGPSSAVTTSASAGTSLRQRAGLVEQHHPPGRETFERAAALDDDADVSRRATART